MTKNIMPGYFYRISSLFFSKKIGVACLVTILLFIASYVYYQNSHAKEDDPTLVALIQKYSSVIKSQTEKDSEGIQHIVILKFYLNSDPLSTVRQNRAEILSILPCLTKLPRLREITFGGTDINNENLKDLPKLPNLQSFEVSSIANGKARKFTDEGLKYLTGMTGLRKLSLRGAIRGPGFKYLKNLNQLEWLTLYGAQADDSGMPHIVANFPKLKRFEFSDTNVTIKGLMQLADLHWLKILSPPQDLMNYEATDLVKKAKVNAMRLDFDKAHLASMRKARAAGIEVMPYDWAPFQSPELMDEILRQRDKYFHAERIKIEALKKKEPSNTNKGWTSYPPKSLEDEAQKLIGR